MKAPACLGLFGAEDKHQALSNESYLLLFPSEVQALSLHLDFVQ